MGNYIEDIVNKLWQSSDLRRDAKATRSALDAADRNLLNRIGRALEQRAAARRSLASYRVEPEPDVVSYVTDERLEGLLVLLTLAAHHSDSLLNLPYEQREARLHEWAKNTGYNIDVVREASILGPDGLRRLADAPVRADSRRG